MSLCQYQMCLLNIFCLEKKKETPLRVSNMRMCAKSSLITKGRDDDDDTFSLSWRSLFSLLPLSCVYLASSSFSLENGPVDHSSFNGLQVNVQDSVFSL